MKWRVGRSVPLNVYEGDRPVCQCHNEQDAQRIVEAFAAVERLEAERQTPSDSGDYVAWMCHKHSGERQWLAMCDSDTPGAFKVYRRTAL